jgi:hypothetical protein
MVTLLHVRQVLIVAVITVAMSSVAAAQSILVLDYNGAKTFGAVHIAGGAIDITSGGMIVTTSSFGFVPSGGQANEIGIPGVAEYGDNAIHDALAEGANYAGGFWNGTNGIMSSTAANNFNTNTAVGWLDNSIGAYSTFRGVPVTTNQSIIEYTYYGDADLSGYVDLSDYGLMSAAYKQSQSQIYPDRGVEWIDGDFDQSGFVDSSDYGLWSGSFLLPPLYSPAAIVPWTTGSAASSAVAVPEPTSLLLLSVAAVAGLGWRFQRKFRS